MKPCRLGLCVVGAAVAAVAAAAAVAAKVSGGRCDGGFRLEDTLTNGANSPPLDLEIRWGSFFGRCHYGRFRAGAASGAAGAGVAAWNHVRGALRSRLATRLSALMVSVLANGSFRLGMCIGFYVME